MILSQDFDTDFDAITIGLAPDYRGPPYAFIRFADGETAIMRGRGHRAKSDGWEMPAGMAGIGVAACLTETLMADLPGLYLGITASEHHPDCHRWLMDNIACSWEQVSFAELFIFANYERFCALDLRHCVIVSPTAPLGNFLVPADAVMTGWNHRPLVDALMLLAPGGAPILVSAGPMANIIIHDYWTSCPDSRKRVILDVGSALDGKLGRRTRQYHHAGHPQRNWKPRFWPAE